MGGAKGSTIVVTTRSQQVAQITSTVATYKLEGLSETDSWSLFVRMAFGEGGQPTNQNFEAIGKEIVKKCAQVPLAIRMMGSLLYSKNLEEWKYFKIKLSQISPQPEDGIYPTLELSYNNLMPHLKPCFAYCRLFPKDHKINVKKLIHLWIGQGFIKSSNLGQSLHQIGYYEYFKLLLFRCFFQEPEEDEWGQIVCYKMHDLMHDLAAIVAGDESTLISSSDKKNIPINTRHVSVVCDSSSEILFSLDEANKLRTLLWPEGALFDLACDKGIWIVSKLRRLRMLDLHGLWLEKLPDWIGELKHLRYLDLSYNYGIKMLSSSITRLQNLLVLDLTNCRMLKELPEDFKKLTSLTHLEIAGCSSLTHMPQGLGQLTSLETLRLFIVSKDHSVSTYCGGVDELKKLNNLRGELRIEFLNHVKNADLDANLKQKEHLQSLILDWARNKEKKDIDVDKISKEGLPPHTELKKLQLFNYPGVVFPICLPSLTNLVKLELRDCERVNHLPPLDGLTSLRDLVIKYFRDLEYIEYNGSNCSEETFFTSLEKLEITNCHNLKGWRTVSMETAMTELPPCLCLSRLEIKHCKNLTSMPPFPSIEGGLLWEGNNWKPLQQTMIMKSKAASTSSSSSPPIPLSKLKALIILKVYDLEYLPDQCLQNLSSLENLQISWSDDLLRLEGEGFRGLTSLRSLSISYCNKLESISGVFQHCTALQSLSIYRCLELDISDDMQWQSLRSLSSLRIESLDQLETLPNGLQHVTTLKSLHISSCRGLNTLLPASEHFPSLEELKISGCHELDLSDVGIQFRGSRSLRILTFGYLQQLVSLPRWLQRFATLEVLTIIGCNGLTTLPNWIGSLASLHKLVISSCSKLISLPQEMQLLTSLQELEISRCPQLSETCKKTEGTDWEKIAHIKRIQIDYIEIQYITASTASTSNA